MTEADAIDAAVFGLEAVNLNAIVKIDTQTLEEVIQNIHNQRKNVANAPTMLRGLLRK